MRPEERTLSSSKGEHVTVEFNERGIVLRAHFVVKKHGRPYHRLHAYKLTYGELEALLAEYESVKGQPVES